MYSFTYDSEIVKLIAEINQHLALIETHRSSYAADQKWVLLTAAESIHFSTKIEGNKLTLKQVTEILQSKSGIKTNSTRSLQEVLNYSKARKFLLTRLNVKLSPDTLLKAHDLIMWQIVTRALRGKYRKSQNVIRDAKTRKITFMPPEAKDVSLLMTELFKTIEKYTKTDSALIAAAVFHFGFVTIHPFMDGNGRIARLFSNYILELAGLRFTHFTSIEKQHEADRVKYYTSLHNLQGFNFYDIPNNLNISTWIVYYLNSILAATTEAVQRVQQNKIIEPEDLAQENFSEDRLAIALTFFNKYKKITAQEYEALTHVGRTQAVSDLNELLKKNKIIKIGGGRSTRYVLKK